MVQDRAKGEAFVFYLSCDISSQVCLGGGLFHTQIAVCHHKSYRRSNFGAFCPILKHACLRKSTFLQVHVRVDHLVGQLRAKGSPKVGTNDEGTAPALYGVGQLCAFGEVLGLPARAPIAQARSDGCSWGSILSFPLKVWTFAYYACSVHVKMTSKSLMRLSVASRFWIGQSQ